MTNGGYYGYSFSLTIVALFYYIHISNYGAGLYFPDVYSSMSLVPFSIFRLAFAYQMIRYYQGKTTKGKTAAAAILSDTPILIIWFLSTGISGSWGLYFPLPIMMIIGLLLLWKFPAAEATVPWEGEAKPTPWWDKQVKTETESTNDDKPW